MSRLAKAIALDLLMKAAKEYKRREAAGQMSLFGAPGAAPPGKRAEKVPVKAKTGTYYGTRYKNPQETENPQEQKSAVKEAEVRTEPAAPIDRKRPEEDPWTHRSFNDLWEEGQAAGGSLRFRYRLSTKMGEPGDPVVFTWPHPRTTAPLVTFPKTGRAVNFGRPGCGIAGPQLLRALDPEPDSASDTSQEAPPTKPESESQDSGKPQGASPAGGAPPLAVYRNENDGIEVQVTRGDLGYHVSLKDLDSGEFLGSGKAFPDLDRAKAEARAIAAGEAPPARAAASESQDSGKRLGKAIALDLLLNTIPE